MRSETVIERAGRSSRSRLVILVLVAVVAVAALFALLGPVQLLMPADNGEGLEELRTAVDNVKGPATVVFGSLSGLGLLAGGAMASMGMPQGIRMMTTAGLAGGGVLLGNGLIE
jgi:hypothetical protein